MEERTEEEDQEALALAVGGPAGVVVVAAAVGKAVLAVGTLAGVVVAAAVGKAVSLAATLVAGPR